MIAISVTTMVIASVTCVACCCANSLKIKAALYMKYNWSFEQRLEVHDQQYDVFVVYNHGLKDSAFVENELLPLLEQRRIIAGTEDCFTPGKDIFNCLETMLKESRSVLVVITPDFLKENWDLYQLNQAICNQIEQKNFKVVFLLSQKPKSLGTLPKNLRLFLRIRSTVKQYKKNWKSQFIYELKHKMKRPVSERLTFQNYVQNGAIDNTPVAGTSNGQISIEVGSTIEYEREPSTQFS